MNVHHVPGLDRSTAAYLSTERPAEVGPDGDWLSRFSDADFVLDNGFQNVCSQKHLHLVRVRQGDVQFLQMVPPGACRCADLWGRDIKSRHRPDPASSHDAAIRIPR